MPRKCLACSSPFRSDIDRLLIQGQSATEVAKYCNDRGMEISSTSILRHTKHIEGFVPLERRTHEIKSYEETCKINPSEVNPLQFEVPEIEDYPAYLATKINRTYAIILTGIAAKSEQWSRGETKFPSDEIRALKNFTEMVALLKTKRDFLNLQKSFDSVDIIPDSSLSDFFSQTNLPKN